MVKRIKILLTLPFSLLVIIPRCTYIHFIFIKRCVHKAAKEISFVENKNYIPVASSNIREKISTVYKCFYLFTFVFFVLESQSCNTCELRFEKLRSLEQLEQINLVRLQFDESVLSYIADEIKRY